MQEQATLSSMSHDEDEQPIVDEASETEKKQNELVTDKDQSNGESSSPTSVASPKEDAVQNQDQNKIDTTSTSEPNADAPPLETTNAVEVATLALDAPDPPSPLRSSINSKSVHPRRKEQLLLQARSDRLEWVDKVSVPYRKQSNHPQLTLDGDKEDPSFAKFCSSHASKEVPTALLLLKHLYSGDDDDDGDNKSLEGIAKSFHQPYDTNSKMVDNIKSLLPADTDDSAYLKALPTGQQILSAELQEHENDPVLIAFHAFWNNLHDPACAMLVQGMRNFCRSLLNVNDREAMAGKLRSYIQSTFSALKSHSNWKGIQEAEHEYVRRSLESFIFGHCYSHLETVLWNSTDKVKEEEWLGRLTKLQFVSPKHLEVDCLCDPDHDNKDLLQAPVEALLSVDLYFSPYEKLQRILEVYREVNAALSHALNRNSSSQKLPSADDVLPTMILVLLAARPYRLLWNLQMIEDFSPPEYLRGEAGYAYTNLYGAVHFLQDLDLTKDQPPSGLSIEAGAFREGLQACRTEAEERLEQQQQQQVATGDTALETELPNRIPPHEIHAARLRGERIDVDWARKWQLQQTKPSAKLEAMKSAFDEAAEGLPEGFNRNYTYLTANPDDIKLSDLPQLLSEYKMLVQATESLIGDRAAKITAARRKKTAEKEKDLYERVRQVDPSLLPPINGSTKWRKNSL